MDEWSCLACQSISSRRGIHRQGGQLPQGDRAQAGWSGHPSLLLSLWMGNIQKWNNDCVKNQTQSHSPQGYKKLDTTEQECNYAHGETDQINKYSKDNGYQFLMVGKDITSIAREKTGMNSVVLIQQQECEFIMFSID